MKPEDKNIIDVKDLTDLLDVAKLVVSTLELDQVLDAILQSAMKLTGTPAGSIALYDKETGDLEVHSHKGFSQEFIISPRWKVREGGLTDRILKSKKPTVISNTANKKYFTNPLAIREGIKSMACVPLVFNEDIIGILYVDDFEPRKFDKRELRLLYLLSAFAAMSIDHAKLHERTRKLAISDGLTGLFNHRHFQEMLAQEVSRAERYGEKFSLMMLDIDDFKSVNDAYGHTFGDTVLVKLAEVLMVSTRGTDTPARYGGEEFAVILPKVEADNAKSTARRINGSLKEWAEVALKGGGLLTLSIGISCFPADADEARDLIDKADQALYEAKRRGKDTVVSYGEIGRPDVA